MKIYVTQFAKYQPSHENPGEMPKLEYVDSLFRRRLSQITRMTIEVVHELVESNPENANLKLVFASFRGEIARQLKINKGLVEDKDVMPAPFSLSVFNTPPAATTIALKMKAGYTAIYPGEDNFFSALTAAVSSVLCGSEKKIIFAYADEKIPEEYANCKGYSEELPLAFACVLSSEKSEGSVELDLESAQISKISPEDFVKTLKGN
ncbi:beta-ketoacyl synthase chain length factor [Treponema sp.]|uniref:beta-ketoacyl synthase chain length factor n=1 Tax=Treponema sp. TaxID=166 RepID=UPI00388FC746